MARTWVERLTCDFCVPLFQREKPFPVDDRDTERVTLPEDRSVEGEICLQCRVQLLQAWYDAWRILGREVDAPESAPEPPAVEETPEPAPERAPGQQILSKPPSTEMPGYISAKIDRCIWPECEFDAAGKSKSSFGMHLQTQHSIGLGQMFGNECPLCPTVSPSMLGRHTKSAHGTSVSGAFAQAEDEGDKRGIVAKQRERVAKIAAVKA